MPGVKRADLWERYLEGRGLHQVEIEGVSHALPVVVG